jgi:cell division protein FtsZ
MLKTIMKEAGTAQMGVGVGSGDDRAIEAASAAISSPLLGTSIEWGSRDPYEYHRRPGLKPYEVNTAAKTVTDAADPEADIIFGAVIDENMKDQIRDHSHSHRL